METVRLIKDAVKAHPGAAILATQAVSTLVWLYILSDGKPVAYVTKKLFQAAMAAVPAALIDSELDKVRDSIEAELLVESLKGETITRELPEVGWGKDKTVEALAHYATKEGTHWRSGKVSGCVYHGGDDLSAIMAEAYKRFCLSNPLHPDVFPSVRKMEAEVISMTVKLFNGGAAACGTMTSGGTESILLAMKAYRDFARTQRGITEPEIVVPTTAHAAFDKACDYFGIKMVHVPVNPVTFRADLDATKRAVTRNTVAIVVSAPSYGQGVIDPVADFGAFAASKGIPMVRWVAAPPQWRTHNGTPRHTPHTTPRARVQHVDCCLGSYLIAFAESVGRAVPLFDFRAKVRASALPQAAHCVPLHQPHTNHHPHPVQGVTSISTDTHKFGFAPKGSSVVMYSDPKYRHAQYFVAPEWPGGIYASPTIAGSRAGSTVAACWATLVSVGKDGYRRYFSAILEAAATIIAGVKALPQLELYGEPALSVVCFGPARGSASPINIYNVSDEMKARGWNLNVLQNPACVHICVTYANQGQAATFAADLKASVDAVLSTPASHYKGGAAAIYGLAATLPDKSLVTRVANSFMDAMYKTDPPAAAAAAAAAAGGAGATTTA